MSIIFNWQKNDIYNLLNSCEKDEILPFIKCYFPIGSSILESGSGLGRFVKYMQDRGWKMTGLEYSNESNTIVRSTWPELKIVQGDVACSPFKSESFDGIISLGVVEHWVDGPEKALTDMFRLLKKGGVAIITVPCLNSIRRFKRFLWWYDFRDFVLYLIRLVFRKKPNYPLKLNRLQKKFKYDISPAIGPFYEYHMSTHSFEKEINRIGFEIIEHNPLDHIDGFYHDLNPFKIFIKFHRWEFHTTLIAMYINKILKKIPYFHCHMQVIIAKKPVNDLII